MAKTVNPTAPLSYWLSTTHIVHVLLRNAHLFAVDLLLYLFVCLFFVVIDSKWVSFTAVCFEYHAMLPFAWKPEQKPLWSQAGQTVSIIVMSFSSPSLMDDPATKLAVVPESRGLEKELPKLRSFSVMG